MKSKFGNRIRLLRFRQNLLLRQLAPLLDMDTAQLSKIERGERHARKETVFKVAEILNIESDELLTLWLADQVCQIVQNEKNALLALMLAEERVKHIKQIK